MKFSKSFLVTLSALMLASVAVAQVPPTTTTTKPPVTTTTPPATTTTTPPVTSTTTTPPTTSSTTPPASSSSSAVVTTSKPAATTASSSSSAAPSATPGIVFCTNSGQCGANQMCVPYMNSATQGYCGAQLATVCAMPGNSSTYCNSSNDCNNVLYSYCPLTASDPTVRNWCAGWGANVTTACTGGISSPPSDSGGITKTLTYAGIGVGVVAALGIAFALVRWQKRRQRSKMPASMFGEIDYGMSDRHNAPLPSSGGAASGAGAAAAQEYPFSSRPHALGAGQEQYDQYDDQYYEEPAYNNQYNPNNNMHPMNGMAGGGKGGYYGQDQYGYDQNQYYGDQKDTYNNGYDQSGYDQSGYDQTGYGNNGAMGGGGGGGFYDQMGSVQGHDANAAGSSLSPRHNHTSPIAQPSRALSPPNARFAQTGDYAMDNYGVEPSELDYSGGQGAQARGNQQYY